MTGNSVRVSVALLNHKLTEEGSKVLLTATPVFGLTNNWESIHSRHVRKHLGMGAVLPQVQDKKRR